MMRYIRLDTDNRVIAWRIGDQAELSEIESEIGEIGETMQPDGTFKLEPINVPPPTNESRLAAAEAAILALMGV